MLRAPRLPLPTRTWAASAPPSPSWISMGQCRVTAGVLTAPELSGATWTAPTPARVKTSSSVPGSQTTPGHTRHVPLLFQWWWLQLPPLLPSLHPSQSSPPTHQFQLMFQPTLTRFQLMLMFQSSLELSHLDLDPTLEPSSLTVNLSPRNRAVEVMLSSFK